MKNSYSRLCLKERWTMFTIFLIAGILCAAAAIYAFIKHYMTYTVTGSVLAIVSLLISGYIFQLNMRRKEIKKEYSYEFDRELFAKERTCPKCGASIGSNVCYCPRCGTKFH
ncbi:MULTISPECIES: hypothetical protein [Bacillota]|jgi:CcmD family protein|uniref:Zinc ribbon domain-containing protein n=2 Tax=Amedibacillus TaxID=2749846 RepID=A0A7G9GPL0_9FIRM|nr:MULTISPECIES: hypothetical protein [Bacillota]QNM12742.1 hypothetical protein H9Q80_01980 [[Eubacterium] hominis]MCH4287691.1 hypothetical protein [Amedibacillus hominis]RGB52667.1 hypothetical protein DW120_20085 [Absiella sp. AM10-20]RGB58297.1 hypothetical protein DW271_00970 [Absiella sp. AM22-9]RGB63014.1 hypothetical protein DW113_18695 [Absiella sp. AM09-45]